MLVDELDDPVITDRPWQTADNYSPHSHCIDHAELAINDIK
jgi:hypothetical protein